MTGELVSWSWEKAAQAILSFVQTEELKPEDIHKCISERQFKAKQRIRYDF